MTDSLPPKSIVLYADDDPDDRQLVDEIFSTYAHVVELMTFPSGEQLLEYLRGLHPLAPTPCLVILDINMPGLSGKDTLRRLRRMEGYEEVPVVLFSTSTLPSEAQFASCFGAGFVTKPLFLGQVSQIIDQMLEHCGPELRNKIQNQRGR